MPSILGMNFALNLNFCTNGQLVVGFSHGIFAVVDVQLHCPLVILELAPLMLSHAMQCTGSKSSEILPLLSCQNEAEAG